MTTDDGSGAGGRVHLDGAVPVGLGLIVLGVLLALDNLALLDAGALLAGWWPVAVLAAGLWWLLTGSVVLGGVAIAVAGLLLAATQGLVEVPLSRLVLPGVLMVLGGGLLQAGRGVRAARLEVADAAAASSLAAAPAVAGPAATAVFGDARLVIGAHGDDPRRVVVTATSVFGDVVVEVPAGWRIEDRITRILGEVTLPRSQPASPASPVAIVHGVVLLGDVRVRYVDLAEGAR